MSAGKQIGQASKQENEQCGSNPPKGLPQAESHKSVDSASQGGYQWQFVNCEQRYATDQMSSKIIVQFFWQTVHEQVQQIEQPDRFKDRH